MGRYTSDLDAGVPDRVRPAIAARRVDRAHFRTNHQGYEAWLAVCDGEQKRVAVHRLLAVAEYGFDAVCDKLVHHGPEAEIPWANWPGNIQLMGRDGHMNHHHHPDRPSWGERVAMYETYRETDLSQPEVADEYGVSKGVVRHSITRVAEQRNETPPNEHLRKEQLSEEDYAAMADAYRSEDVTHADLAERYGVHPSTVSRGIRKANGEDPP